MNPRNFALAAIVACVLLGCGAAFAAPTANSDSATAAKTWIERYRQAWEHQDPGSSTNLFAQSAVYRENPFGPSLHGTQEVRGYWNALAHDQRDVHMTYRILSVRGNISLVFWDATFARVPSGLKVELEGIAEVTLDQNGKCVLFREWWNSKHT